MARTMHFVQMSKILWLVFKGDSGLFLFSKYCQIVQNLSVSSECVCCACVYMCVCVPQTPSISPQHPSSKMLENESWTWSVCVSFKLGLSKQNFA